MLQLTDVKRELGGRVLFDGVTCRIGEGDRIGLVGANGAGKTTLLSILRGADQPDGGEVEGRRDLRVGFLPQEVASLGEAPILQVAIAGAEEAARIIGEIDQLESRLADGDLADEEASRLADLHTRLDELGGYDLESRARRILSGLGFSDDECERSAAEFSGGWMMRVALARILMSQPDLLLLDEPTNHLDLPSLEWLETYLQDFRGAILVVSHDQFFLDHLCTSIFELAGGTLTRYAGNYTAYVKERDLRREQLEKAFAQQQKVIAQQERFIERFRAKNTKASQVQSRVKMLDKMEKIELPQDERRVRGFKFPEPVRTGQTVCSLQGLSAGYGDHVVLSNVDLEIERGDRIALVGKNGEGKSTLAKIITGELAPLGGELKLGHKVATSYFGQHQIAELDLDQGVLDCAAEKNPEGNLGIVRSALGAFLFDADDLEKQVGVLSGGEKNRLALARMLLQPAPLLVLDEPTNHLDMASREALEEALDSFQGTIVMVSHDRRFLNRLATVVLEVGGGKIERYRGNYDDYVFQRERRAQARAEDAARRGASTTAPAAKVAGTSEELSAKEKRKLAHERREALKPLRRDVQKLEKAVADLETRLASLDEQLADPAFYESDGQAEVFQERADVAQELEAKLDLWMTRQGELEEAEAALET